MNLPQLMRNTSGRASITSMRSCSSLKIAWERIRAGESLVLGRRSSVTTLRPSFLNGLVKTLPRFYPDRVVRNCIRDRAWATRTARLVPWGLTRPLFGAPPSNAKPENAGPRTLRRRCGRNDLLPEVGCLLALMAGIDGLEPSDIVTADQMQKRPSGERRPSRPRRVPR